MLKKINLSQVVALFKNVTSERHLDMMRSFFMGKWYPIWVAFSVLVGRFTCKEAYFAMIDFTLVAIALLVCKSLRPVLPNLITFLYRVPLEHGPGTPYYSDYYSTEPVIIVVAIFAALFVASLVYFYIRNKSFAGVNFLKLPMFIPLALLSLSFFTAGLFSGNVSKYDLGFSALQVLVFFLVYFILYFGLRSEDMEELTDYFVYISAMCAVVLSVEVFALYAKSFGDVSIGSYLKSGVLFGWGISNTCGNVLSVLPPLCLLGVMRSKKLYQAIIYYAIALLALLATVLTFSRSSMLVGAVCFAVAMIVSAFAGKQKWLCRLAVLGAAVVALVGFLVFKDKAMALIDKIFANGFNDNGRYRIWKVAISHFKDNPWFGNGHFSLNVGIQNSLFTPRLAHNTIIQILTAMGIFGMASYVFYRVATFFPFFKRFTSTKFMLLISCAILVGESLLDNFIFWFNPLFVYNICIVLAVMHCEQTKAKADAAKDTSVASDEDAEDDDSAHAEGVTEIPTEGIVCDSPINDSPISTITV